MNVTRAIVFIGHGSRNDVANREMDAFVERFRSTETQAHVSVGYIELAKPFMGDALREAASKFSEVIAVPLLLFRSGHAKNDIPLVFKQVRAEFPNVRFYCTDVFGVHPHLAELANIRADATGLASPEDRPQTAVIYVGRGSSDADANGDLCKQARVFAEGRGFAQVLPAFIGITQPKLPEALEMVARARPKNIIVIPHMLFSGVLVEKMREIVGSFSVNYPWIRAVVSDPLGEHDLSLKVVNERIAQAMRGEASLPCDNCKFRAPLPGQEEHVGGLKALLWSIRHTFTHNQAMPHEHAHRTLKKHVLVCGNVDCASKGSIRTILALRHGLKARGLSKEIAVTRTSCMGHCGEGPTMAVYPDGIWYRGVLAKDADDIIDEHLVSDRIVARLVDNIM